MIFWSSRRGWLTPVLSHHRAYRSVHGGFNSLRALTGTQEWDHKSPTVPVFLLLELFWPLLCWSSTSIRDGILPLDVQNIPERPVQSAYASLSWTSSIVSKCTYEYGDTAIHSEHRLDSSCLRFRSSSSTLLHRPLSFQVPVWCFDSVFGKKALSIGLWTFPSTLHELG